jgi:hypothetical protein
MLGKIMTMMKVFLFRINVSLSILLFILPGQVQTLTTSKSDQSRSKLIAALSSPSGKLTLSPEIIIPEPKDATSILLLSNAVQTVSERIRSCKSNVAFVHGSITALQTFTNEQASAVGNFPGPVPTIYCCNGNLAELNFSEIATAGADGVLIGLCRNTGEMQQSIDEIGSTSETWMDAWQAAIDAGLQPIPEVVVDESVATLWTEDNLQSLISTVVSTSGTEPVALVLTINPTDGDDKDEERQVSIPHIPKNLSIPILGSVRATAGDHRLHEETVRFKEAGYTGAFLRSDCVPGFRLQPNLEIVGKFWYACISDLKSTRSKSFSFRSKNRLEVSVATKWGNYQKSVIESGALGDPDDTSSLNEADGDYQGFA